MARRANCRRVQAPGTYWEYNDVRINQFSLALLHLFGRPLPEVFREAIMEPLGASENWQWVGYDNAWIETQRAAHAVGSGRDALGRGTVDQRERSAQGRASFRR